MKKKGIRAVSETDRAGGQGGRGGGGAAGL